MRGKKWGPGSHSGCRSHIAMGGGGIIATPGSLLCYRGPAVRLLLLDCLRVQIGNTPTTDRIQEMLPLPPSG